MKEMLLGKIGSNKMFGNFYRNKKILVTGNTGFKGSWLSTWLLMLGANVCGFSKDIPTNPSNFKSINIGKKIRHFVGDVKDIDKLRKVFKDFKPEIVFHLAAQPLVRKSYKEPIQTFETNILGTMNILECIKESSFVKAGVMITSDKAYRNQEWIWGYRENDLLGGEDPYSASKGCAELVINSYCKSFFQDGPYVASTRAGNVIGGGDMKKDRIVPDIMKSLIKKTKLVIRSPSAVRPWQHVLEPLHGYLILGNYLMTNKFNNKIVPNWNFGPNINNIKSVKEIANKSLKLWNVKKKILFRNDKKFKEVNFLMLNSNKAKREIFWKPKLNFNDTMKLTVDWYKSFHKNENLEEVTKQQIQFFLKR